MTLSEENLGPPALRIAGFQLWVHGRQFPEAQDYWDGNWLNVTAHCGSAGASVWVSGAVLMVTDLARFAAQCRGLSEGHLAEATLSPLEPELRVLIGQIDRQGHLVLRVEITPDPVTQQHSFEFAIDQSYLPALLSEVNAVLREYPIREPEQFHRA